MTESDFLATPARTGSPFAFVRIRDGDDGPVPFLPGDGTKIRFASRAADTLTLTGLPRGFLASGDRVSVSYLGTSFTFDADDDLDNQVNILLVQLSDAIAEDAAEAAGATVEDEDRDDALAYARRPIDGRDATERLDPHCSDLKVAMEGFLAVCLAAAWGKSAITGQVNAFHLHAIGDRRVRS